MHNRKELICTNVTFKPVKKNTSNDLHPACDPTLYLLPRRTSTHHDVSLEQERRLDGHTQTPAAGALEVTAEITAVMERYRT